MVSLFVSVPIWQRAPLESPKAEDATLFDKKIKIIYLFYSKFSGGPTMMPTLIFTFHTPALHYFSRLGLRLRLRLRLPLPQLMLTLSTDVTLVYSSVSFPTASSAVIIKKFRLLFNSYNMKLNFNSFNDKEIG